MSGFKSVLSLLCDHLERSLDVSFKPEYFISARNNEVCDEAINALWEVLDKLCFFIMKYKNPHFSLSNTYDIRTRVKLYMAYVQYSNLSFYALSRNKNENSRSLLLAFTWLLANNALPYAVAVKYSESLLGKEFTFSSIVEYAEEGDENPVVNHVYNIVRTCGKLNHNLKHISELMSEKVKLATKVHSISQGISNLPHLSVMEMSLVKQLFKLSNGSFELTQHQVKRLFQDALLLDNHFKWIEKDYIFFKWMVELKEPQNGETHVNLEDPFTEVSLIELVEFISTLRLVIKEQLDSINEIVETRETMDCSTRLLQVGNGHVEIENWLLQMLDNLTETESSLEKSRQYLYKELRVLMRNIPNCVEI